MTQSDDFRGQLLHRINSYRESERRVRERFDELKKELDALAARRGAAENLYTAEFGDLPAATDPGKIPLTQSEAAETPEGPLTGMSWVAAITTVLEEHGPLHVKDIWQFLQDGGFRTGSRDPLRSVVAMAIRSEPQIIRVGANRYAMGHTAGSSEERQEEGGNRVGGK